MVNTTSTEVQNKLNISIAQWNDLRDNHIVPFIEKHAEENSWYTIYTAADNVREADFVRVCATDTKAKFDPSNHITDEIWLDGLIAAIRLVISKLRKKQKAAAKREAEEDPASASTVSVKKQQTLQATTLSEITFRVSVDMKNVDARSILLRNLVNDDESQAEITEPRQLRAAKLMQVLHQKFPDFTENSHHVYDRTLKDENVDMIVDDDDLEVAVAAAMRRGDTEVYFVVVTRKTAEISELEGKKSRSDIISNLTNM